MKYPCKGRVDISHEGMAALMGVPANVQIIMEFDYERDMYKLLMRSETPVEINGQPLTVPTAEGCCVPYVDESFLTRTVISTDDLSGTEHTSCFREAFELESFKAEKQ